MTLSTNPPPAAAAAEPDAGRRAPAPSHRPDLDVIVCDVAPRDGLQIACQVMATEGKIALVEALAAARVPEIETGSFVPAKVVPTMAGSAEVTAHAAGLPGPRPFIVVLAPNLRGAIDAIAAGADRIVFVISVSETHNRNNVRRSVADQVDQFRQIRAHVDALPPGERRPRLMAGVSTVFGCSFEGAIDPAAVLRLVESLADAGADEMALADTVGYARPSQVRSLFGEVGRLLGPDWPLKAHFHDTMGLGLANVVAALEADVRAFDASLAGLGGCPFAPGASGNIVTEDLVHLLQAEGLRTGIDLDRLIRARAVLETWLPAEPRHGHLATAGYPTGFQPERVPV